jgi:hypothetical protein
MQRRNMSRQLLGWLALAAAFAGGALSCSRDSITSPSQRVATSALAARTQTLSVTSASPAFGDQGTTLDVHIFGSGFTAGAQATWLLNGAADPGHVRTNGTQVISSSELVANITIASDASLAFWDVQVSLSSGKNGVGSDAFEVTSAQILGAGTLGGSASARTINDQLQIIGTSGSIAWIYDDATGMVPLGTGGAGGLDPLGAVVVGGDGNSLPTAWIRQADNSWSPQALPLLAGGLGGSASSAARLADGTLLAVGRNSIAGKRTGSTYPDRPVSWQRINGAWTSPQILPMPAGAASAAAQDVNGLGQVTGTLDAPSPGIVWDGPASYTLLDGVPGRINASGTLIVGQRKGDFVPVYWWRDPVTHAWHTTGIPLPIISTTSCTYGYARDVNDAGVIVGWSCDSSGERHAAVWQLDLSGPAPVTVGGPTFLPGLGTKVPPGTEVSVAAAVTNSAPYVVTGHASSGNVTLAVRWLLR